MRKSTAMRGRFAWTGVLLLSLGLLLGLAACGGDDPEEAEAGEDEAITTPEALYEAARAEGQVEYWSPSDPQIVAAYLAKFEETYPGIQVNHFQQRDPSTRTLAEANAGVVSYDLGEVRIAGAAPMMARDIIARNSPEDWQNWFGDDLQDEAVLDNGRLLTRLTLAYNIIYNTDRVSPDEVPQTYEELLDPRWRGNLLVESRANIFAYLALHPDWGEERAIEYAERIRDEMDPIYVSGGNTLLEQLIAGVADISIGANLHQMYREQARGAPIDFAPVSPLPAGTTIIYLLEDSPNPNAARLLAGWLASDPGIEAILEVSMDAPLTYGPNPAREELEARDIELIVESMENYHLVANWLPLMVDAVGGS